MTFNLTPVDRTKCERHPTYKVWMDGSSKTYSDAHRRDCSLAQVAKTLPVLDAAGLSF